MSDVQLYVQPAVCLQDSSVIYVPLRLELLYSIAAT